MTAPDHPKSSLLAIAAILALFLFFGGIIYWVIQTAAEPESDDAKRGRERLEKRQALDAKSRALLDHYGWVDKPKGIVHIPIQRAMELAVDRLKNKPVRPAGLIQAPVTPAPSAVTNQVPAARSGPIPATNTNQAANAKGETPGTGKPSP